MPLLCPLRRLTGTAAYLIRWEQCHACSIPFEEVEALEWNLEVLVDRNERVLAYRYDVPISVGVIDDFSGPWVFLFDAGLLN